MLCKGGRGYVQAINTDSYALCGNIPKSNTFGDLQLQWIIGHSVIPVNGEFHKHTLNRGCGFCALSGNKKI